MRNSVNETVVTDSGVWGVVSLGLFAFVAAAMIYCTKFFKAKADVLLETPVN